MKIDNATRMSILYDYYGRLLTEKQSRIFRLYHDDNLSLSEIGDELKISKQGIHDALKKAESVLEDFEDKLGLVESSLKNEALLDDTKKIIIDLSTNNSIDESIKKKIRKAEKNISRLSI